MNASYDCSQPVEIEDEPHHHLIIANEYVRALAVEIPPHVRTLCHHHPHDYLLYVASGAGDHQRGARGRAEGSCITSTANANCQRLVWCTSSKISMSIRFAML